MANTLECIMQLSVKDVVKLFNVSERTVYRWIKESDIPYYRLNEQYRFNRVEILEWATSRRLPVSPEIFQEEEGPLLSLSQAIAAGGIHYRVGGADKKEVLRNVVELLRLPEEVDVSFLLQVLLARESLGSTAIGDGIAIPHSRSPIVLHINKPMVALCFLEHAIDFDALDKQPVSVLFTLITPTVRSHLHLLSRLAFALKDPQWLDIIRRQGTREEILDTLRTFEQSMNA